MGLVDGPARGKTYDAAIENYAKEQFQPYTPEELEVLKKHYTTGQMEALEAGEAAIDPKDLSVQGRLRRDSYKLPYLDDFSRIVPTIDRQPTKSTYTNSNSRWLSTEEYLAKLTEGSQAHLKPLLARTNYTEKEWEAKSPEEKKHITQEVQKSLREHQELDSLPALARDEHVWSRTSILNVGGSSSNPAVAPALGTNIPDVSGVYTSPIDPEDSGLDDDGKYQDLKRRTGMSVRDMTALTCKVLVARFVHNQTRLGKIRSVAIMAIAGNGNGRLGIGEAKSTEAAVAIQKAKLLAIGNMQPIRRYEDRTIHGDIDSKFGATIVKLQARPPGIGFESECQSTTC